MLFWKKTVERLLNEQREEITERYERILKNSLAKNDEDFEYKFVENAINGSDLAGWLKMSGGVELVKWIENLENALKYGLLDKPTVTNEELQYRKGEVNALKKLGSLIKDIRLVKEETEKEEGEQNG